MTRHLLGLQKLIYTYITDGQSRIGWTYLEGATKGPLKDRPGPFWVHEVYQLDDPLVTSRITVPVLFDTKTNTIVNSSWAIVKILPTAFAAMGKLTVEAAALMSVDGLGRPTIIPDEKMEVIESKQSKLFNTLFNGVYTAGIRVVMNHEVESEAVLAARRGIYDKLAATDKLLPRQRFVLGDKLTVLDVHLLAMKVRRWDCAYHEAFILKDDGRGGILLGSGYPHLKAYLRELCVLMEPLVDFRAMRQYYRIRQSINKAFVRSNGVMRRRRIWFHCPI